CVGLEEKQLFEKFWKGTFKAVATPRPESVIVASITAHRRMCPLCSVSACSPSFDEELSPRPKGKKKKRKSERKRKRKRSQVPFINTRLVLSCSLFVCLQILSSKPGSELLHGKGSQHLSSQTEGPHDYDSGNDTSSPPSSKTGVSQANVTDDKKNHCKRLASPEKLKFTDKDNASDSGNSVTSYASLCKPYIEDGLSATLFSGNESRRRLKTRSSSSRSRSRSSGSSRYSGRYSRSLSLSSCRKTNTHCVDLVDDSIFTLLCLLPRLRDRKRMHSSREKDVKHAHKVSGKRQRRKSYSPMKKRRRDSPSHLEARRITRYSFPSRVIYSYSIHSANDIHPEICTKEHDSHRRITDNRFYVVITPLI
uniref:Serine/arginine repetitive matrix 4 n=1 Tax=Sander lucioperca TaxID=283035 RepID=A0A8D0ANI9_SANLU